MLTLFRLLQTLLARTATPARDTTETLVTRWRVLPNDVDAFGHMNNSRYLAIMDLGRIDFLRQCALLRGVLRRRWSVPVGGAHLQFRRALKPLQRYELHTRLLGWDERWFYFRQEFFRAGDPQPVCTGHVKTLFVGRAGPVAAPEVVLELAGRELAPPAPVEALQALLARAE